MKTIYLDSEFMCHVSNDGTMIAVETDVFDGKCDAYIETYRFVPDGYRWTRSDGTVFDGEMIAPFKDCTVAAARQEQYESDMIEIENLRNTLHARGTTTNE